MQADEFASHISKMCSFYGRKLDHSQVDLWFNKVGWVHHSDLANAVDSVTSEEKSFPTPAVLLKHVDIARMSRAARERQIEDRRARNFFNPASHNLPLARDCVSLIEKAFSQRNSGMMVADGMAQLENKYPGIGFRDRGIELARELVTSENKKGVDHDRSNSEQRGDSEAVEESKERGEAGTG